MHFESEENDYKKLNITIMFEFKLFVYCSIASKIQTNFLVLFLTNLMVQKMLKLIKK